MASGKTVERPDFFPAVPEDPMKQVRGVHGDAFVALHVTTWSTALRCTCLCANLPVRQVEFARLMMKDCFLAHDYSGVVQIMRALHEAAGLPVEDLFLLLDMLSTMDGGVDQAVRMLRRMVAVTSLGLGALQNLALEICIQLLTNTGSVLVCWLPCLFLSARPVRRSCACCADTRRDCRKRGSCCAEGSRTHSSRATRRLARTWRCSSARRLPIAWCRTFETSPSSKSTRCRYSRSWR